MQKYAVIVVQLFMHDNSLKKYRVKHCVSLYNKCRTSSICHLESRCVCFEPVFESLSEHEYLSEFLSKSLVCESLSEYQSLLSEYFK